MRCHLCSNWIEIETDPEHRDYKVVSGAKRKMEIWEPDEESGVIKVADEEHQKKMATDPLFLLEHKKQDEDKKNKSVPQLEKIIELNESITKNDYEMSSILRKKFRASS